MKSHFNILFRISFAILLFFTKKLSAGFDLCTSSSCLRIMLYNVKKYPLRATIYKKYSITNDNSCIFCVRSIHRHQFGKLLEVSPRNSGVILRLYNNLKSVSASTAPRDNLLSVFQSCPLLEVWLK